MMAFSPTPCSRSVCSQYSKLNTVKTMGTHGKINAIWWNFKINVQKLADICGYELPTNLQNFTQKDLTDVKIFQKVLGGGYFFWNTLYIHYGGYGIWIDSLLDDTIWTRGHRWCVLPYQHLTVDVTGTVQLPKAIWMCRSAESATANEASQSQGRHAGMPCRQNWN